MAEGQGLWKAGTQAQTLLPPSPQVHPITAFLSSTAVPAASSGPSPHPSSILANLFLSPTISRSVCEHRQIFPCLKTNKPTSSWSASHVTTLSFLLPLHCRTSLSPSRSSTHSSLASTPKSADRARVPSPITRKDLLCMLVPALSPLVCKCEIGERELVSLCSTRGMDLGPLRASSIIRNSIMRKNICTAFHVTKGLNLSPAQSPLVVSQSH